MVPMMRTLVHCHSKFHRSLSKGAICWGHLHRVFLFNNPTKNHIQSNI